MQKTNAKVEHADRDHALLSASGASRWMNCTPSARLEEKYGEKDTSSKFSAEGTCAHELAELYIRHNLLGMDDNDFFSEVERIESEDENYYDGMINDIQQYVDFVEQEYNDSLAITADSVLLVEEKVDLREYVPESFGTCDAVIIADGVLKVIDLKFGKGVRVDAHQNKQLSLYALGAYLKYRILYDIETIELAIVQPRIDNISTWSIEVEDLMAWAEKVVKKAADAAFNGEGDLKTGDWCRFCKVKHRCAAMYADAIAQAQDEFKDPSLIGDIEISEILDKGPRIVEWINSVIDYAKNEAVNNNTKWPGYKLVAGRSVRVFDDEEAVANKLRKNGFLDIYDSKLKSLTNLEKMVGKKQFGELLSDHILKKEGALQLVRSSDKRPELGFDAAVDDFKD
jgi:hypothetical protein